MTRGRAWLGLVVAAVFLGATPSEPALVAVLGFRGVKDSGLLEVVSDAARGGAARAVRGTGYRVVDRAKIEQLQEEAKGCSGDDVGECDVLVAKYVKATLHVSGNVKQVGKSWFLSVSLYHTGQNILLASMTASAKTQEDLVPTAEKLVEGLVNEGLLTGTAAAPGGDPGVSAPEVKSGGPRIKKSAVTAAVGELRVDVRPKEGVRLEVTDPGGKKEVSGIPYAKAQAAVGTWKVVARADGFEDDVRTVEVPPDELTAVKVVMKALGGLTVTGTPAGAAVRVVGPGGFSDEGGLPWEASGLKSGTYTVTVTRWGYLGVLMVGVFARGRDVGVMFVLVWEGAGGGAVGGMVRIPGGTFMMGSHDGDDDEKPEHKVTLGPYAMDKTEVTVAAYAACVKAGACTEPDGYQSTGSKQLCTYGASGKEQHPVNCVDWTQAEKFCRWKGGRLPTEAEWEHAARGSDGRKYPWGNTEPNGRLANGCGRDCVALAKRVLNQDWTAAAWADDGWEATSPVGTFPAGASPFGLLDMAGNVWEWTSDWYGAYSSSNQVDPKGASSGATRVCRGGSWFNSSAAFLRAANRVRNDPSSRVADVGFRCARGSS